MTFGWWLFLLYISSRILISISQTHWLDGLIAEALQSAADFIYYYIMVA
jgi:hypothetical protein